jgi:drug/metabolite transporter (DMT)-like permease
MSNTKTFTPSVSLIIWVSFLVLTLAWGSSFILVKRGLQAFSSWQVASIRLSSAFLALGGLAFFHLKQIPKDKLKYVIFSGILSMFVPAYLFSLAQMGISSSVAGVLNALTPAFTFIVGILFFKQPSKLIQVVGLLIGFIGSALLILVNSKGEFSLNAYAFCIVIATACYGLNVNILKKHLAGVNPLHMTTVAVSVAGILGLVHLLSTNWLEIVQNAPKGKESLAAAVTLGLIGTAFSQVVFNKMLQYSTAVFASSITYFIPIVALMWGVWDGEILSLWQYVGMAGIIAGILILNKSK